MNSPLKRSRSSAFSLIEMVVVVGIIAIISVFAVPAANTLIRGSQLTQASQLLTDQIALGRQQALAKNRPVEVRFYRFADPEEPGEEVTKPETGKFRAIQLFEVLESGTAVPLGKLARLPGSTMINDGRLSNLINTEEANSTQAPRTPTDTDPELPRGVKKNYQYSSFRFFPDGSTSLSPSDNWYATVHATTDVIKGSVPPPNFYTLQIDPVSGVTRSYRPSAG